MNAKRRPATYDDLCRVPEHLVAEIIEGDLFTSPRPATPHARAAFVLGGDLSRFDGPPGRGEAPGGWWFLFEPELHFGADVLVPDVAGWRRERVPAIPNVVGITVTPGWVCEVLSPSAVRIDRGRKMRVYARAGVLDLWFLDPIARTLETYRREDGHWVVRATFTGDDAVRAAPFDAVALVMRRWWLEE